MMLGASLVRKELPGRLHLLQLGEPHARGLTDVCRIAAPAVATRPLVCGNVGFDLAERELTMTDCWVNIMPRQVVHSLHLHPLATLSGTYYVKTPSGCPGLKFEDPRLDRFMAAPPRTGSSRPWVVIGAEPAPWSCSRAGCGTRCPRIRSRRNASVSVSTTGGSEVRNTIVSAGAVQKTGGRGYVGSGLYARAWKPGAIGGVRSFTDTRPAHRARRVPGVSLEGGHPQDCSPPLL